MISIRLSRPGSMPMPTDECERLGGFSYFWAQWVTGFNPHTHCLYCLLGFRGRAVHPQIEIGPWIRMIEPPEWKYLYICGVTKSYNWNHNFHLVAAPGDFEADAARGVTFNGIQVDIQGGRRVEIADLPRNYAGMPDNFTTCRNWRLGVQEFGVEKLALPAPAKKPWNPAEYRSAIRPLWAELRRASTAEALDAMAVKIGQVVPGKMREPMEKELWHRARSLLEMTDAEALAFARELGRDDLYRTAAPAPARLF